MWPRSWANGNRVHRRIPTPFQNVDSVESKVTAIPDAGDTPDESAQDPSQPCESSLIGPANKDLEGKVEIETSASSAPDPPAVIPLPDAERDEHKVPVSPSGLKKNFPKKIFG